jgi:hypothetical protein
MGGAARAAERYRPAGARRGGVAGADRDGAAGAVRRRWVIGCLHFELFGADPVFPAGISPAPCPLPPFHGVSGVTGIASCPIKIFYFKTIQNKRGRAGVRMAQWQHRDRVHALFGRGVEAVAPQQGAAAAAAVSRAFPSWKRPILTEIYLCRDCSDPEFEDGWKRPGRRRGCSRRTPSARRGSAGARDLCAGCPPAWCSQRINDAPCPPFTSHGASIPLQ